MVAQLKRASGIAQILSEEGLGFLAAKLGLGGGGPDLTEAERREIPVRLRRTLERLGTLFVKFGQVLATRRDLLPAEYCDELAKLHASVKPFETKIAHAIIEEELGRPASEVFARVDDLPLAAASVAQVYGAELLDGRRVVLKVRRPHAVESVTSDVELLLFVSRQLDRLVPPYRAMRVHRLAEEFARRAVLELDLLNELRAAQRFAHDLRDMNRIRIPVMEASLSTPAMLVMERFDGKRVDTLHDAAALQAVGFQPEDFVRTILACAMEQIYLHGFVHADMHPGNVFVLPDGKIGLIDFGMSAEIPDKIRAALMRSVIHRVNARHDEMADALLEVVQPTERADPVAFRAKVTELNKKFIGSSVDKYSIGAALNDEGKVIADTGYWSPSEILMMGRALIVVEGLAIRFAPHMVIAKELQPIMQKIMLRRFEWGRLMESFQVVIPDLMQHLEVAPKALSQLLAMERRFAESGTLAAIVGEGGKAVVGGGARGSRSGVGPWVAAVAVWGVAAAAALVPAPVGTPLIAGVPWFGALSAGVAVALTLVAALRR